MSIDACGCANPLASRCGVERLVRNSAGGDDLAAKARGNARSGVCMVPWKSRRMSFLTEIPTLQPNIELHKMNSRQQLPQTSNNDLLQEVYLHHISRSCDLTATAVCNLSLTPWSDPEVANDQAHWPSKTFVQLQQIKLLLVKFHLPISLLAPDTYKTTTGLSQAFQGRVQRMVMAITMVDVLSMLSRWPVPT